MSLGLGIFLSSIVFSAVILYWITRDRWRWRSIARWIAKALGALLLLGTLSAGAVYAYLEYPEKPGRQEAYVGLKLGSTMQEVLYAKGMPSSVLDADQKLANGFYTVVAADKIPKGKTVQDYANWEYEAATTSDGRVSVAFAIGSNRVRAIGCYSRTRYACPALVGIGPDDDEQSVLLKLGKPSDERLDGVTKSIEYPQFNLKFYLEKRRVYWLQVVDHKAPN
jgi:hypothetical protein